MPIIRYQVQKIYSLNYPNNKCNTKRCYQKEIKNIRGKFTKYLFIVPKSQSLARLYIKESNIDFLPKLISEKKFINVMRDLTIFVEEYKKDGKLKKIYINENINIKFMNLIF